MLFCSLKYREASSKHRERSALIKSLLSMGLYSPFVRMVQVFFDSPNLFILVIDDCFLASRDNLSIWARWASNWNVRYEISCWVSWLKVCSLCAKFARDSWTFRSSQISPGIPFIVCRKRIHVVEFAEAVCASSPRARSRHSCSSAFFWFLMGASYFSAVLTQPSNAANSHRNKSSNRDLAA